MIVRPMRAIGAIFSVLVLAAGTVAAGGSQERDSGGRTGGGEAGGAGQAQIEAASTEYGTIEYLEGEVTVNGETARIGRTVESGDRIVTGPSARAEIVFDERNIFQLRPDTILTLAFGENEIREADLEQGAFAAVFDRLRQVGEGQDSFRIDTPTAVGGVRGTSFFVQVEDPRSTYICTCEGSTHLTPEGADIGRDVDATHHTAFRFVQTEEGVETESAEMIYHNDAEMEELAGKIGVTLPWE